MFTSAAQLTRAPLLTGLSNPPPFGRLPVSLDPWAKFLGLSGEMKMWKMAGALFCYSPYFMIHTGLLSHVALLFADQLESDLGH